jgi:hypothetical protein
MLMMETLSEELERWKPVPGYSGHYEISCQGRIKSYKFGKITFLKPKMHPRGYPFILLSNGKLGRKKHNIHQLVIQNFGPPQPENTTVDHINRIRTDNRIQNLRWATQEEQIQNTVFADCKGEKNPSSKLKEQDVIEILKHLEEGKSRIVVAQMFNVTKSSIGNIILGVTWSHLTGLPSRARKKK